MKTRLILLFCLFTPWLSGQNKPLRNSLKYGVGYFGDVLQFLNPGFGEKPDYVSVNPAVQGKAFHGFGFRVGYERLLDSGFLFSTNLSMSRTKSFYNDPLALFWNQAKYDHYLMAEITFSKDLAKSDRYSVLPVAGLIYRSIILEKVNYSCSLEGDRLVADSYPTLEKSPMDDLGCCFGLDVRRNFHSNLYLGLCLRANYLFDIGLESVSFCPVMGVRF